MTASADQNQQAVYLQKSYTLTKNGSISQRSQGDGAIEVHLRHPRQPLLLHTMPDTSSAACSQRNTNC